MTPATLELRDPAAIRARRRPRAVLWLWGFQASLALVVAWPAARSVADALGARPDGDAALFADGAEALVELLGRQSASRAALTTLLGSVGAAGMVLGVAPLIAALGALGRQRDDGSAPRLGDLASLVARRFWATLGLLGLGTLAEGALLALAVGVAFAAHDPLVGRLGEARGEQLTIALGGLLALGVAKAGVLHDLARAALVHHELRLGRALQVAYAAYWRRPIALLWAWAWRATAGLGCLALGVVASSALGGRASGALVALAVIHQLAVLVRVALRTSWLAVALREIAPDVSPPPADA